MWPIDLSEIWIWIIKFKHQIDLDLVMQMQIACIQMLDTKDNNRWSNYMEINQT